MKFSIFSSVKSSKGEICTQEKFNEVCASPLVRSLCKETAAEPDHEKQQVLKKQLPVITWNAWFEGQRKNALAHPSGCFMLDVDGVENPDELWNSIVSRCKELGILLAHKTPSGRGLRLVCKCRKEFITIDECQQWLAKEIGVEHDPACKDWARSSYVVPIEYIYYVDGGLFTDEPDVTYDVEPVGANRYSPNANRYSPNDGGVCDTPLPTEPNPQHTFKGIPLADICHEWLMQTGGEPEKGERNDRLRHLALRLRHITDFNEQTMLAVMPNYGLSEEEMKSLIHSACVAQRTSRPRDLQPVLDKLMEKEQPDEEDDYEDEDVVSLNEQINNLDFTLPPLIKQIAFTAPDDFLAACVLCQLPMLGTLASKLRAQYLDGKMHSPSFNVSLEAPQASGKSFMTRIADILMAPVRARDEEERQKEQAYVEKLNELKVTNVKVTPKNRDELLGQKPKGIIRYVPATISITKLLQRLDNARGLHLFALAEEIDTVTKAFKRGFSSYGDLLRVAFDNGLYGQDYASTESFSGLVSAYYNTLFSGTPRAMRRFYPDVEDGLVSRVCFVMLPDQFGKPMPVWGELKEKDKEEVMRQLERLDQVSIIGNTVQPDHVMDLAFLNRDLKKWLTEQQEEAVRTNDRTRDVFCRRSAVVGFRAGMLAWFLYGEKNTPLNRRRTCAFARWVANQMLTQHLLRFEIDGTGSNVNRWEDIFEQLPEEFSRDEVQQLLKANGVGTSLRMVLHKWRLLGCIKTTEVGPKLKALRFSKCA